MAAAPGFLETWVNMITNAEKINIIKDKIEDINFHILGLLSEKETEYFQKELYEDFYAKLNYLNSELLALTNQG